MKINPEKRDKIIDSSISALKVVGKNDLFFGLFLILEGLSLLFVQWLFPLFIALSILIAYAFALEWLVNVMRHDYTIWNVIERILIVWILIGLLIYCGFMIFNADFRINVDRVIVCATTVIDGIKNLFQVLKIEKRRGWRNMFMIFSLLCITYGIVYGILGGAEANIFTTTMHGIVFIFCGAPDIWIYLRDRLEPSTNR